MLTHKRGLLTRYPGLRMLLLLLVLLAAFFTMAFEGCGGEARDIRQDRYHPTVTDAQQGHDPVPWIVK